jgi:O-antigen/teichoic acid export membrane protein
MHEKEQLPSGEQKSFLKAIQWSYTLVWGEKGISAILFFVLAGLLGPRDFGAVSIATIYVSFLQMFLDQGLATALIQRRTLEKDHLNAVFWTNLMLGLGLVLISIFFSRDWATFNHDPQLAAVISVLSFSIVLQALSIVHVAILQREMNFRSLSIRSNISMVFSGIFGVWMAFYGFGVWSLVGQQIVRDIIALVLLWRMSSWRPNLRFSWRHLTQLLGFSLPHFVAQLANFFDSQVAAIVLGIFFGPVAVGLYKLAERAMLTVLMMSSSSIHTVSFGQFSRLQNKPVELKESVLTSVRMSSIMSLPALAGLAMISDQLIANIGSSWEPASDALKVLCIVGVAYIVSGYTSPLLQALGRPQQSAILEWARTVAGIGVLIVAGFLVRNSDPQYQVLSIAAARLFTAMFLVLPIFIPILLRVSGISLRDFVGAALPSILASLAVILSVACLRYFESPGESGSRIILAAEVVIGTVGGVATLLSVDSQLRSLISRELALAKRRIFRIS